MIRTLAWLIAGTLGVAACSPASELPRPLVGVRLPVYRQDDKAAKDSKNGKEAKDKDGNGGKNGKEEKKADAAPSPMPTLWPTNPFPPPAPPVLDPRTGAWEQVYGPCGVQHVEAVISAPGTMPATMPAVEPTLPAPAPVTDSQVQERGGMRDWLDRWRTKNRTRGERSLHFTRNAQTGTWEIQQTSHRE
jgi:hypothetical protein